MIGMWLWWAHSQVDRASSAPALGAPLTPGLSQIVGPQGVGVTCPLLTCPKGDRPLLWASSDPESTSQLSALWNREHEGSTLHGLFGARAETVGEHSPGCVAAVGQCHVAHTQMVE